MFLGSFPAYKSPLGKASGDCAIIPRAPLGWPARLLKIYSHETHKPSEEGLRCGEAGWVCYCSLIHIIINNLYVKSRRFRTRVRTYACARSSHVAAADNYRSLRLRIVFFDMCVYYIITSVCWGNVVRVYVRWPRGWVRLLECLYWCGHGYVTVSVLMLHSLKLVYAYVCIYAGQCVDFYRPWTY